MALPEAALDAEPEAEFPCDEVIAVEDVELLRDLALLPSELAFPEVGVAILLREIPPALEEEVEFCVSDLGGFPGDGGTAADCCVCKIERYNGRS